MFSVVSVGQSVILSKSVGKGRLAIDWNAFLLILLSAFYSPKILLVMLSLLGRPLFMSRPPSHLLP